MSSILSIKDKMEIKNISYKFHAMGISRPN